jgi:hypothetical protein
MRLISKLFAKVKRVETSDCWLWGGRTTQKGYGHMDNGRKVIIVHRFMYEQLHGITLTSEEHVLHSCDTPHCCNPSHLRVGTNQENILDKLERDRSGKKLNIQKVREIKMLLKQRKTHKEIAVLYGVNQSNITRISTGARWGHVNISEASEAQQAPMAV